MSLLGKVDQLKTYRAKRDFGRTAEPQGSEGSAAGSRFVVQKHDARRLHYDLRLELDGALLSWAVPNGPSAISTEKRLAVRTEDHPLKYLDFEGTIPKGEYGGGTMIVWDRGDWVPLHDPHKSLAKGHLEFELKGQRLKGRWHLVRLKNRAGEKKEQWLLIKAADEHERSASDPSILEEQTSILSGRANDDLNSGDIREDHKGRVEVVRTRKVSLPKVGAIKGARKGLLRPFVEPSLASPAVRPPLGAQWWHEVKFDGYRIQARVDGREVKLLTRSGLDWTDRFSTIAEPLRALGLGSALIDGEIVVNDEAGISNFNALVSDLKNGRQDRFRYYAFDLLYFDGSDLQTATLADRKRMLERLIAASPDDRLALSEHFEVDGAKFFVQVSRLGLEGMISKRSDRPYSSGRTKDWLKSKCVLGQEFVVVGYVPSTIGRGAIGSLVLGFYEKGELIHAGRAGSGFQQDEAQTLFKALENIRIDKPKFGRKIVAGAEIGVRWVEPRLVADVDYRGWSNDGLLRHVTFRGLREDKNPREIGREDAANAPTIAHLAARITHPDRVLWPADGITKQGLADFYLDIADWIMPHLLGRPLSLVRCPSGIAAECFYAKHAWAGLSDGVGRIKLGEKEPALFIENVEGLLALVQSNVLEIHPWGAKLADPDRPDRLIFDLDPGEEVPWSAVVDAAREVRERLSFGLQLESFVKTTGGKGLHVVAPFKPTMNWEAAKAMCKEFAGAMASDSPGRYVANMAKSKRQGKIFVDYLRNGRGATAVAAYSTRARVGATVSMPLAWNELSSSVPSDHFRISNAVRRLKNMRDDPWAGFFETTQRIGAGPSATKKTRRER